MTNQSQTILRLERENTESKLKADLARVKRANKQNLTNAMIMVQGAQSHIAVMGAFLRGSNG